MSDTVEIKFAPANATLKRKTLGLRVLALNLVLLVVVIFVLTLFDQELRNLPEWSKKVSVLPFVAQIWIFFMVLILCLKDLAIHFLPEPKWKYFFKEYGDKNPNWKSPQVIATELEQSGYHFVLMPLVVVGAMLLFVFGLALILGGGAYVMSVIYSAFSSTPSWAVVIIVLLVLILLK